MRLLRALNAAVVWLAVNTGPFGYLLYLPALPVLLVAGIITGVYTGLSAWVEWCILIAVFKSRARIARTIPNPKSQAKRQRRAARRRS